MNLPKTELTNEKIDEPTGKIFPKFLDIVENSWASKDNPNRVGIFIKRKSKTILLTDGKGNFFEPFNDKGSKLKIIGNLIHQAEIKARIETIKDICDIACNNQRDAWINGEPFMMAISKYKDRVQALEKEIVE